jgi:hypothetical protein
MSNDKAAATYHPAPPNGTAVTVRIEQLWTAYDAVRFIPSDPSATNPEGDERWVERPRVLAMFQALGIAVTETEPEA